MISGVRIIDYSLKIKYKIFKQRGSVAENDSLSVRQIVQISVFTAQITVVSCYSLD